MPFLLSDMHTSTLTPMLAETEAFVFPTANLFAGSETKFRLRFFASWKKIPRRAKKLTAGFLDKVF